MIQELPFDIESADNGPDEFTVVMIKPDAFARGETEEIIAEYVAAGLEVVERRTVRRDEEFWGEFYIEHEADWFYGPLKRFFAAGAAEAVVLRGRHGVEIAKKLNGHCDPKLMPAYSIRKRYRVEDTDPWYENCVHASGTPEEAIQERKMLFD